jgi:type I restriction enzyme S subunit
MAGEWKLTSLREAGVSLIDCDHRTPPAAESGYPYIAIPQLKEGRLDLSDVRRISSEHFVEWTRKARPQHHDVVLSRRCNPGETAYVPAGLESALGQNLVLLRSDGSRVFPPFLRWLVRGPDWWEQIGTFINVGAVFDSLKCADIPNFKMPLPPLAEQKAIAAVLGALDDKIELNRRMNATLEAMARALFQSWFVDFDPVRAKLDGRKPEGLDKATAALFPSHLAHEAGVAVPQGWSQKRWGDIATLEYGKSLRDYRKSGGRYRVYGTNGTIGFHDEALCDGAGIVIGRKGAYRGVHYSPDPFFVIDTTFFLKPKAPMDLRWAYYELLRFDINSMDSRPPDIRGKEVRRITGFHHGFVV